MNKKQDISQSMLLLDEDLRSEVDKAIRDIMLKYADSIPHRLVTGNILRSEGSEMVADLLKIAEEISERYLLNRLIEIDELLKINPSEFNNYMDLGKSVGLAYCIRYHLQQRKAYEKVASEKAKKGDWRFFQYCTGFYTQKAERKAGAGRPSKKKAEDVPSFESASKRKSD